MQVSRNAYINYFKINASIFCCPLFLKEYLNPQLRINKMVNKHTVDYHPSRLPLTSRIHPLIFLWTPKRVYLSRIFLQFFLIPVYPAMVAEKFKFMVLRLLANGFASQKIESVRFCLCHQAKLSPKFLSLRTYPYSIFWRSTFSPAVMGGGGKGRIMELKKSPKLNFQGSDKLHHLWNLCICNFCFFVP